MFIVLDGTAHQSLKYEWAVNQPVEPARVADIIKEIESAQAAPRASTLSENDVVVTLPHNRDDALADLKTYNYANWDSEGAKPITTSVVEWSKQILDQVPRAIPNPDVSPAASGSVCMEWTKGKNFVWADVEPNKKLLTLIKIAGQRTESAFDIADNRIQQHLATALTRLYS